MGAMIIGTAAQAAALLAPIFESDESEKLAVLHLGEDLRLIGLTFEGTGGASGVELPIGAILSSALRLKARSIVVAHNHPSGNPAPSASDEAATRALAAAAAGLDIGVHDHLIFAVGEFLSFRSLGLL
jgi:DNA repair protein RadC